jgi:hypothetical protein
VTAWQVVIDLGMPYTVTIDSKIIELKRGKIQIGFDTKDAADALAHELRVGIAVERGTVTGQTVLQGKVEYTPAEQAAGERSMKMIRAWREG